MANSRPQSGCLRLAIRPVLSLEQNETVGFRWPKSFLRCPTFCPKLLREDTRRDPVARLIPHLWSRWLAASALYWAKPPGLSGSSKCEKAPRNLRISGANFMGVSLRKHSPPGCSGVTHCDLLPRKEAGCQHAKARRVSSSRSLAARMSWAERCIHRSATPPFCFLLRKAAGGSKERQIAKTAISSDIGQFSAAEASMEFPAGLADRWF